jgi:hypothetical protein
VPSSSKHSSNEDTADKLHIVRSKSFEVSGADLLNWGIDLKPFMKEESLPVFFGTRCTGINVACSVNDSLVPSKFQSRMCILSYLIGLHFLAVHHYQE